MKRKYYPFSPKLIKALKRLRVYSKAKAAYDSVGNLDCTVEGKVDDLDSCFIFDKTKEGNSYWYDITHKTTE